MEAKKTSLPEEKKRHLPDTHPLTVTAFRVEWNRRAAGTEIYASGGATCDDGSSDFITL